MPQVPPKLSPFTFGDESYEAGQSVSVQCSVISGDLPVNITWLFNNEPIPPLSDIVTSTMNKRISVLAIESVGARHVGNYTCFSINNAGNSSYTSALFVNGYNPFSVLFILELSELATHFFLLLLDTVFS